MNYYERHIGDYQKDTATLSLLEHGAYMQLLDTYYATEMPLPAEMVRLYRVCRAVAPEEQAAVEYVVERFFQAGADGLRHNARADEEIERAQARIAAAQENGRKGGRPKKEPGGNPGGKPSGNPAGNPEKTQRQSSPDPRPHAPPPRPSDSGSSLRATAVELAIEGKKRGIDCAAHQPALMALADQGVSVETFAAACDYAKAEATDPHRIPIRFVASILSRWAKEAAGINVSGAKPPAASRSRRETVEEHNARALAEFAGTSAPNHGEVIDA